MGLQKMLNPLGSVAYPFGQYIRLLILTAQRRTEVASVRWVDLDLDASMWTIPAANTKGERSTHILRAAAAVVTDGTSGLSQTPPSEAPLAAR